MRMTESIRESLTTLGYLYEMKDDGKYFVFRLGEYACILEPKESSSEIFLWVVSPSATKSESSELILKFLNLANQNLGQCFLLLHPEENVVMCKSCIDVSVLFLTNDLIRRHVEKTVKTLDEHYPSILGLLDSGLSTEDALRLVNAESSA
jgi:hypothetical protein